MLTKLAPILRCRNNILLESKNICTILAHRYKSTKSNAITTSSKTEVGTNVKPLGEKVRETTKTASYLGVILLGVGVTGTLFYAVFSELFSSQSPNNIYSAAVKKCLADYRIEDKLGLPIKAYGEETRRRRRQHPSYFGFIGKDGKKHLRMQFYLEGAFNKGTAHLEMVEDASGKFAYKYLFVEVNDLLQSTIVLEDNTKVQSSISPTTELLM